MAANAIACAACSLPVPRELWNRAEGARCPGCGRLLRVVVFPAIANYALGALPSALQGESEASCFYHPRCRAVVPCGQCGRFLCALCDLEVDGRHVCPRCFEKTENAEPQRTMYDSMALAVSTFPMLLFWPALIGAPWALFLVVRRWNAPSSIVPRTKIRFVLAALFALAEIGFFIFVIYMMTQVAMRVPRR
jgi:uncharacterized paraquat-inducible protein A